MKLTAAIVMSYPNAQVRHIDREYDVCAIYKGNDTIDVIHDKNGIRSYGALRIYQCQLILTPLSKISDEDAVEVAKMAISKSEIKGFKVVQIRREDYAVKVIIEFDGKDGLGMYWVNITSYGMPQFLKRVGSTLHELHYQFLQCCIDYLRSNGYDLGHGSIPSLIAAGVAMEKK